MIVATNARMIFYKKVCGKKIATNARMFFKKKCVKKNSH